MNIFKFIGSILFKKQKKVQTVSSEMQTAIETWLNLYAYGTDNIENRQSAPSFFCCIRSFTSCTGRVKN